MTIDIDTVPSATEAPARTDRSQVRADVVARHFGRRSLLKSVFALGVAVGLVSLEGVARLSRSYAAPSNWGDCPNWINRPGAAPDWKQCNPDGAASGYISGDYCDSTGYHRSGQVGDAPYTFTQYSREPRCLDRNAWVWRTDGDAPEPRDRRCSDGRIRRFNNGRQIFTHASTCQRLLPWRFPPQ